MREVNAGRSRTINIDRLDNQWGVSELIQERSHLLSSHVFVPLLIFIKDIPISNDQFLLSNDTPAALYVQGKLSCRTHLAGRRHPFSYATERKSFHICCSTGGG